MTPAAPSSRPPEAGGREQARRSPGRRWCRVGLFALLALAAPLLLLGGYVLLLLPSVPDAARLRQATSGQASVLMSSDGQVLDQFSRTRRSPVTLDQVSPQLVQALLATEDRHFYEHRGVDPRRTAIAVVHTLAGKTQGGSTLTQQLARNLFPKEVGRERSLRRKLKEVLTALAIEREFGKTWILEAYLNSVPFLYNVVGVEMAARTYWGKPASELDVLESATLIGMLKGASYYNPVLHPQRAQSRRNVVLARMVQCGLLSPAQLDQLRDEPLRVSPNRPPQAADAAPHFVEQVRRVVADWADEHGHDLYRDGLVVQTTLDSRLQAAAVDAVSRHAQALQAVADVEWSQPALRARGGSAEAYARMRPTVRPFAHFWQSRPELLTTFVSESADYKSALAAGTSPGLALNRLVGNAEWLERLKRGKTRLESGFMAIDPTSGEVRAWVGSRDHDTDQFDHVGQARRQPGSTFKPFVYGAALESGIDPERIYIDGPVEIRLADGKTWLPTDMQPPSELPMSLRDGLVHSKNSITVQVSADVGVTRIATLAEAMGVDRSKLDPVPSLALGTSPVSLYEMVNAYATIARQGEYRKPLMVRRIVDRHGAVVADFSADDGSRRALSADSAVELIDMLRGVVSRGTGTLVRTRFGIEADIAGKTGTTQNNADGWFILMHPGLVAGAWVGFNDSRVTMRSNYWGQGGHNAALVVGDFFRGALKAGLIDGKASFPPSRRPPPAEEPAVEEAPVEGDVAASLALGASGDPTPPPGIVALPRTDAPPMTAEELESMVRRLDRDRGQPP